MTDSPIGRVVAVSTGTVRVRPQNIAGDWRPMLWWTATSRTWSEPMPIWTFAIEHPRGLVLFDLGQSPASVEPGYYPGGFLGWAFARQASFAVERSLPDALAGEGIGLPDASVAVVSHLHQDHAGNIALLEPGVPVLVSAQEHGLLDAKTPEMHGVMPRHVSPKGANLLPVPLDNFADNPPALAVEPPAALLALGGGPCDDPELSGFAGAWDLYGDGSLVLLSTPGHTPGSASLLIRRGGRSPLLLVGDVTYDPTLMPQGIVPGTGAEELQRATAAEIVALAERLPGLVVLAAHDPAVPHLLSTAH